MRAVSRLHSKTTRGRNCTAGEQHLLFESSRVVSEQQRGTARQVMFETIFQLYFREQRLFGEHLHPPKW